jgi:hypothetical protein
VPPITDIAEPHAHTAANTKYISNESAPLTPTFSFVNSPSRKKQSVCAMLNAEVGTRVLKSPLAISKSVGGMYLSKRSWSFFARAALISAAIVPISDSEKRTIHEAT